MGHDDIRVGGDEHSTRRDAPNPPVYRKLHYEDKAGSQPCHPHQALHRLVGVLFREVREKEIVKLSTESARYWRTNRSTPTC